MYIKKDYFTEFIATLVKTFWTRLVPGLGWLRRHFALLFRLISSPFSPLANEDELNKDNNIGDLNVY